MEPKVFLHYTQAELDRKYDQQAHAPNFRDITGLYPQRSADARAQLSHATHAYGPHPDELLDLFVTDGLSRPTLIFLHGGAWQRYTKDDFSFVAPGFVRAGVNCAMLNFSKLPGMRLPDVIAQVRRAVIWLVRSAETLRIDPGKFYLCGHSSGAQMAAVLSVTDWSALGLDAHPIRGATLISGSYDLKPVLLSARGAYVKLSSEEEHDLSPIRHVTPEMPPVIVASAGQDSAEFRRHSEELARTLQQVNRLSDKLVFDNLNHFEIMSVLGQWEHELPRRITAHIEAVTGERECGARGRAPANASADSK
jgi:arylformamidase